MTAPALLTKLFGAPEEINGRERCPTYLYRWIIYGNRKRDSLTGRIFGKPRFKIYLHKFVHDDWSRDLHDHPKRFISIGLKGGYIEWTPCRLCNIGGVPCGVENQKLFLAPWFRSFPAEHIHRLTMLQDHTGKDLPCWTLVIVLQGTREWGFWHLGKFIPWREYVQSDTADAMKACGGPDD